LFAKAASNRCSGETRWSLLDRRGYLTCHLLKIRNRNWGCGETELYYFRARYYDATLGRFVGRDPLGYVDGMSLYGGYFVPGGVDPSGLEGWFFPWDDRATWKIGKTLDLWTSHTPAEHLRGLYTTDTDELESTHSALSAAGTSVKENRAREVLPLLDQVDPTGLSGTCDAIVNGMVRGETNKEIFTAAGLSWVPGGKKTKKGKGVSGAVAGGGKKIDKLPPQKKKPLSPSNYPNPDPPLSAPPVRYEPETVDEVIRMRRGQGPLSKKTHGSKNIEGHHRKQRSVAEGGTIDELEMETHRGAGNHSRHNRPSELTPEQRSKEIREHWIKRGLEYILPGEEGY